MLSNWTKIRNAGWGGNKHIRPKSYLLFNALLQYEECRYRQMYRQILLLPSDPFQPPFPIKAIIPRALTGSL